MAKRYWHQPPNLPPLVDCKCGGKPKRFRNESYRDPSQILYYSFRCQSCEKESVQCGNEHRARNKWNNLNS
jgi:hypothetical protein